MTGIFKKAHHVTLVNESELDDDEEAFKMDSDRSVLISEEEEHVEDEAVHDDMTHNVTILDSGVGVRRWLRRGEWKFWKRRRYKLQSGDGNEIRLCGRSCRSCRVNSWRAVFLGLFAFAIAILISVTLSKLLTEPLKPVTLCENRNTVLQGAVSSDASVCTNMSAKILRNGSAVDAAITAMLCNGVVHAESSGIGGGGFMTVRLSNGSVYVINFRETAPLNATQDMFHSNSSTSEKGGLSVAVPGELRGMELAHRLFGKLPWKSLFEPVIELCRNGYNLTQHTASGLRSHWNSLPQNIQSIYRAKNGQMKQIGDLVTRPLLANTLEAIANGGVGVFYGEGEISRSIINTVNSNGGIFKAEDLTGYEAKLEKPLKAEFAGHTFYAPPTPAGGPTLLFMLSLMDHYHLNNTSNFNLTYHRLVEAFKFSFGERTSLGDPFCDSNDSKCQAIKQDILKTQNNMFNKSYVSKIWSSISDDHTFNISHYHPHFSGANDGGTTHISILSPNGDAVAVTSTVNTLFGSNLMTSTGIILNDEMDDFSSPNITNIYGLHPSETNFILPGKRPLSSTSPTIAVTNDGCSTVKTRPFLVIGASGGSMIPTAIAQAILRVSIFNQSISTAIESKRVHHQLLPDVLLYEQGFSEDILAFLDTRGHKEDHSNSSAVIQGVYINRNGAVTAHSDSRKQGLAVIVNPST